MLQSLLVSVYSPVIELKALVEETVMSAPRVLHLILCLFCILIMKSTDSGGVVAIMIGIMFYSNHLTNKAEEQEEKLRENKTANDDSTQNKQ